MRQLPRDPLLPLTPGVPVDLGPAFQIAQDAQGVADLGDPDRIACRRPAALVIRIEERSCAQSGGAVAGDCDGADNQPDYRGTHGSHGLLLQGAGSRGREWRWGVLTAAFTRDSLCAAGRPTTRRFPHDYVTKVGPICDLSIPEKDPEGAP